VGETSEELGLHHRPHGDDPEGTDAPTLRRAVGHVPGTLSRAVFAHELHVSARTLERWERSRTKPKEQAATLIMLVSLHTLEKAHHHSRNYHLSGVVTLRF
jgi:hypothetical protein